MVVTSDGRPKILDFGFAVELSGAADVLETMSDDTLHRSRGIAGTPAYMSPQQLRGEPADQRDDLWSAGVLLYEMLTGRRPFCGATVMAVGRPSCRTRFRRRRRVCHQRLRELLNGAGEERSSRFQRSDEMLSALDALLATSGSGG